MHSLPVELQGRILDLAAADLDVSWTQGWVCRRWEARRFARARRAPAVVLDASEGANFPLPFMLAARTVTCEAYPPLSVSACASAILAAQLPRNCLPALDHLQLCLSDAAHLAAVTGALSSSTQLTYLSLGCDQERVDGPEGQPAGTPPPLALHLPRLVDLSLDLDAPSSRAAALPPLFAHLSAMTELTALFWNLPWQALRSDAVPLARLFLGALPELPRLRSLAVGYWPCTLGAWQDLPGQLTQLSHLTSLALTDLGVTLENTQIAEQGAAPWLRALAIALADLPHLRVLCVSGDARRTRNDARQEAPAAGSRDLALAVGALTGLFTLRLSHLPHHLSLTHCCSHLTSLSHLTDLTFQNLSTPPAPDAAGAGHANGAGDAEGAAAAEGAPSLVSLLGGLTGLVHLSLDMLPLRPRDALSLCFTGLLPLTRLETLSLCLCDVQKMTCGILANTVRSMPLLEDVTLMAAPGLSPAEWVETVDELNWLAGGLVFS